MPSRNLVSWTSTISSLIRSGRAELGLREFFLMCNSGLKPNEYGFSLALKASRIASESHIVGKLIHGCTIKSGFESYAFCSTAILDMYSKSCNMIDARKFFDTVEQKCDALWNTVIDGYARSLDADEAVNLFHQMLISSVTPNRFTHTILINLSARAADIDLLRFLHGRTIKVGCLEGYSFVGGAVVDAYCKWGEINDAFKVFMSLEERDHVAWSVLLVGFCKNGDLERGLDLYLKFISDGCRLDPFMFVTVFNLCSDLGITRLGLQVHSCLAKSGFVVDSYIGSALVGMYVSYGMIDEARTSFHDTTGKNEVVFSVFIHGLVSESDYRSALESIYEMRKLGLIPDCLTLSCMLKAFASHGMLDEGKVVHAQIFKTVSESDLIIGNNLMEMYAKCGVVDEAINVFMSMKVHNEFSWTCLISGYTESEKYVEALKFYYDMKSSGLAEPNEFTLVAVLQATSKLQDLHIGKEIHGYIVKKGFQCHAYVESELIGMYSKCGCIDDSSQIFSTMQYKDLVSWSNMIASCAQQGHGDKAVELFSECKRYGLISIDETIFSCCLSVCSSTTGLKMGRAIHAETVKTGFESNLQVGAAAVDMYCKCGSIIDAQKFFDGMREHSMVTYTAMITGYAHHGLGYKALWMFDEMKKAGVEPDGITYLGVLTACSHFGLVTEGWDYFESMREYGVEQTVTHYACMVDLLGRAGQVSDAEKFIAHAPFQPKTLLWRTLLGACTKHGNVEDGNRIAEILIRLEPSDPSSYVMLSNIYASVSMWDHSSKLKNKMKKGSLKKIPGCSWIEVAH